MSKRVENWVVGAWFFVMLFFISAALGAYFGWGAFFVGMAVISLLMLIGACRAIKK